MGSRQTTPTRAKDKLTDLRVLVVIPLPHAEVDELKPMEMRRMPYEAADAVEPREETLAGLQILKTKSRTIERVVAELADTVVTISMEGIDAAVDAGVARTFPEQLAAL